MHLHHSNHQDCQVFFHQYGVEWPLSSHKRQNGFTLERSVLTTGSDINHIRFNMCSKLASCGHFLDNLILIFRNILLQDSIPDSSNIPSIIPFYYGVLVQCVSMDQEDLCVSFGENFKKKQIKLCTHFLGLIHINSLFTYNYTQSH